MKSLLFFLITAAVWAQPAAPPAVQPAASQAQTDQTVKSTFDAGQHLTAALDTVVATFGDGQKLTVGELNSFLASMPPNMQQAAQRDRKAFVQQFALMHRLSEMAEKA